MPEILLQSTRAREMILHHAVWHMLFCHYTLATIVLYCLMLHYMF